MPDFLLRKETGELEIVSGAEPFTVTPAAGSGSYDVYRLDNGGSVTLGTGDLTAPILSELGVEISNDQATLNWSTDEGNGTAYWVCTTQVDIPSSAQVISGQDHTGAPAEASGSVTTTTSGTQTSLPVDGLASGQSYTFHLLQQDASGNISNTLSDTTTQPDGGGGGDIIPPVLRYLNVAFSGTTANLTLSSDEANGTLYWVLTTSAQLPVSTHILSGQGAGGSVPVAAGNQLVNVVDTQPAIVIPTLSFGTEYHFYILQEDEAGNLSTIQTLGFTPSDETAPILSNIIASASGSTATLDWSTNEGNGTGYWVCTSSATAPSGVQIIAGQNENGNPATASGMQSVSAPGVQADQVVTGLSSGQTYFFHLLQRDDSENTSTISSTTGVTVSNVSATINIVERSYDRVAPEGFFFDISLNGFDTLGPSGSSEYDPRLHELYYFWDFGDPGDFTAPVKLSDQHKNANVAYGPVASHTFQSAGTYTVSCLVVEPSSGKSAVASIAVSIGDPNVFFSGSNTIFVDTTGTGAGAPAGAVVVTNLQAAINSAVGQVATPKRIMLRRGQTFSTSGYLFQHVPTLHIVAEPGTDPKPIVNSSGVLLWNNTAGGSTDQKDFTFQNIDFRGTWDASDSSGANNVVCIQTIEHGARTTLIDQCEFDGFANALIVEDIGGTNDRANTIMNDCISTNWRNYTIFCRTGRIAATGCRFFSNPNALSGDGATGVQGGPIRIIQSPVSIVHSCDLFSNAGWTNNIGNYYIQQPCIRCVSIVQPGAVVNMQANSLEGGLNPIAISPTQGTPEPINAIIEKNVIIGTSQSARLGDFTYGGITIRNNIGIFPNVRRLANGFNAQAFFNLSTAHGGNTDNFAAPVRAYNNTFIDLMSNANAASGTAADIPVYGFNPGAFNSSESNNLIHKPNLASPVTPDAPLDITPLWEPRGLDYRDTANGTIANTATPTNAPAIYRPTSGSDALGDALNEPVAFDDFFGNPRPQYPSRGAFEIS